MKKLLQIVLISSLSLLCFSCYYDEIPEGIITVVTDDDVPEIPVSGCTDEYADNFNSEATSDDGSCSGYPENGEYNLVFDGVDDFVEIDNNSIFTNSGDLTNNFTINLSFKKDYYIWAIHMKIK